MKVITEYNSNLSGGITYLKYRGAYYTRSKRLEREGILTLSDRLEHIVSGKATPNDNLKYVGSYTGKRYYYK